MIGVTENLAKIQRFVANTAIEAGRDPNGVAIVAVGKHQPVEKLREAVRAGQKDFGENFVQEALGKRRLLGNTELVWHFIGAIQSNKTKAIAGSFDWVHTIDRVKIAERLSRQRPHHAPALNICLQVNIDSEPSKAGVAEDGIDELAEAVRELPRLTLRGLMCVPKPEQRFERQRVAFARLRSHLERLNRSQFGLDTLSMGMSDDLRAAIFEGATLVRIGTAIFGARE